MKRFSFLHQRINEKTKKEIIDILLAYQQAIDVSIISSITDTEGTIIYANDKFCSVSQYSQKELLGKKHNIINSGHHSKEFFDQLWQTIRKGEPWSGDIKNKAKDGSFYWVDTVIIPVKDESGEISQYLSLRILITEKKKAEELRKEYTDKLKEMLQMTSHSVRRPLANCLGLVSHIEEETEIDKEELRKVLYYLKKSALELDSFTKDLTTFMTDLEQKYDRQ